jgi:hypothetical protein
MFGAQFVGTRPVEFDELWRDAPRRVMAFWLHGVGDSGGHRFPLNMGNMDSVRAFAAGDIVRSTTAGKDECHVVEILRRKVFDRMVHRGDIDTHAIGGAHFRRTDRSGEESQLHADPDQDKCDDRGNGMCAHDGSFGCKRPGLAMLDVMQSTVAAASSEPMRLILLLLCRLPLGLLEAVGHANHLRFQPFTGRAADIVDDDDRVLAGETDPTRIAIAPVPCR